jgi:hypothetical protein
MKVITEQVKDKIGMQGETKSDESKTSIKIVVINEHALHTRSTLR